MNIDRNPVGSVLLKTQGLSDFIDIINIVIMAQISSLKFEFLNLTLYIF